MKQPWFIGLLISIIGVTLWFALCIFVVWLCKKRKAMKKQKMQEMYSGKSLKRERFIVFYPLIFPFNDFNIPVSNNFSHYISL